MSDIQLLPLLVITNKLHIISYDIKRGEPTMIIMVLVGDNTNKGGVVRGCATSNSGAIFFTYGTSYLHTTYDRPKY